MLDEKIKDGILDIIVNAKKLSQRIFARVVGEVLKKVCKYES